MNAYLDPWVRSILRCPACQGELADGDDALICTAEALSYPIRDGIPVLLVDEAVPL